MARKIHYTVYVPANLDYELKQYLKSQPADRPKTEVLADLLRRGLSQAKMPDLTDLNNNQKVIARNLEAIQEQNTSLMTLVQDLTTRIRQQQDDTHIFYQSQSESNSDQSKK